jgi:hypothetical protein
MLKGSALWRLAGPGSPYPVLPTGGGDRAATCHEAERYHDLGSRGAPPGPLPMIVLRRMWMDWGWLTNFEGPAPLRRLDPPLGPPAGPGATSRQER